MQDARNLLRHGGLRPDRDWLQFDCALSYGLVGYLRTLEALRKEGWSPRRFIAHGGHQLSLSIAAGLYLAGPSWLVAHERGRLTLAGAERGL